MREKTRRQTYKIYTSFNTETNIQRVTIIANTVNYKQVPLASLKGIESFNGRQHTCTWTTSSPAIWAPCWALPPPALRHHTRSSSHKLSYTYRLKLKDGSALHKILTLRKIHRPTTWKNTRLTYMVTLG